MAISREDVLNTLQSLRDPVTHKLLGELGAISDVLVQDEKVYVDACCAAFGAASRTAMQEAIVKELTTLGGKQVEVAWTVKVAGREVREDDPVPEVLNVIAVMSGKGGVGKSTTAANLAVALAELGARVGLLDADMYGPSVPTMFGVSERPVSNDGQRLEPVQKHGIKLMSIGFLIDNPQDAIVWRGPMLHSALVQFLRDVNWGELDYLLLDLPPGTGDIPLTLSQKLQMTGAIIVTTPQEVALQDVYKSVSMCQKVHIPVLGVIENESYFVCDGCSKRHYVFGQGGGKLVADMAKAPLLAQIPIDSACRAAGDAGCPVVLEAPQSVAGQAFLQCAETVSAHVAKFHATRQSTAVTIDRSGGQNRRLPVIK